MMTDCTDVCEVVIGKLVGVGFLPDIDGCEDESHDDVLEALSAMAFVPLSPGDSATNRTKEQLEREIAAIWARLWLDRADDAMTMAWMLTTQSQRDQALKEAEEEEDDLEAE